MDGFPYTPRPGQRALIEEVQEAARIGRHAVLEAATGTGKTVAVLSALVQQTAHDGRRILWTTRTNSQQEAVVREHRALRDAGTDPGTLLPFMGRRNHCPLLRDDDRFRDGTPEELGRLCRDAKRRARQQLATGRPEEGACPYFLRLLTDGTGPIEALLEQGLDGQTLGARIEAAGSCPYEALKALLPQARTVVVPRIFVLDDALRDALLGWMGAAAGEVHLVLDEAHHLPDAARAHHTPRLGRTTLVRAQKEAMEYQDPVLAGTTLASTLIEAVTRTLHATAAEYVHNGEDGLVPPGIFEETLMREVGAPTPILQQIANDLEIWGQDVRADRQAKGRLPRSYLGALAGFLHAWLSDLEGDRVGIVTGGDDPAIERYLLHPAPVLAWLQDFWCTLHISGTMAPLAEHLAQCGLPPDTRATTIPSPFSQDHLRLAYVQGIDHRWSALQEDPSILERQHAWARSMLAAWPGRCGLFFTSHRALADALEEGLLHACDRPVFVERPEMDQRTLAALVEGFRRTEGALLLGVLGGRLTEGIDYPGDAMEHMLVFGVPYPRPTARTQALIHYYDRIADSGWSVAVHTPVGRVLRQTVGRLVRGPEDRGVAVILDERAVRFQSFLPGLRAVVSPEAVVAWPTRMRGYQTADQWLSTQQA